MNALNELMDELKEIWKSFDDIDYWYVWPVWLFSKKEWCIFDKDTIEKLKTYLEDNFSKYDRWYWSQQLDWEIVFKDWSWLERWEYDWSERWEYKCKPKKRLTKVEQELIEINSEIKQLKKKRKLLYQNLYNND